MSKDYESFTEEEVEKYRKKFVISALRRATYKWPWRSIAIKAARVGRGVYLCAACGEKVQAKDKKLDHKDPVVDPKKGFEGWDRYIRRLLTGNGGWQVLCKSCHDEKTAKEREERKKYK